MLHSVKILEPTDLWYLQNNINKETNKHYHPTKNIPFVQQLEIKLENSGVVVQRNIEGLNPRLLRRKCVERGLNPRFTH